MTVLAPSFQLHVSNLPQSKTKVWLARPVKEPVLLHICHETRTKALPRYTSRSGSFTGSFEDFRVNFERDVIAFVEKRTRSLGDQEVVTMDEKDLFVVQNIDLHMPEFDQRGIILERLGDLIGRSSELKAIHLSRLWSYWIVNEVERLWVQHWTFRDGSLPT